MARKRQLKRMPVEWEIVVYRIVGTDALNVETLAPWFIPDRADNSKEPDSRERQYPELQDGRSMFATEEQARIRWAGMRKNATQHAEAVVRQGDFIAEVVLQPGQRLSCQEGAPGSSLLSACRRAR